MTRPMVSAGSGSRVRRRGGSAGGRKRDTRGRPNRAVSDMAAALRRDRYQEIAGEDRGRGRIESKRPGATAGPFKTRWTGASGDDALGGPLLLRLGLDDLARRRFRVLRFLGKAQLAQLLHVRAHVLLLGDIFGHGDSALAPAAPCGRRHWPWSSPGPWRRRWCAC